MNIRKKITIWISGTVVISTLVFSSVLFVEMLEQPFVFIDKELDQMARALVSEMEKNIRDKDEYDFSQMTYSPDKYWIKVIGHDKSILYQSGITQFTEILPAEKTTYMVEKNIPRNKIWLEQDENDDVTFRVKLIPASLGGSRIMVHIAKPIEAMDKEIKELLFFLATCLGLCTLVFIFVSYKLAGKILAPISAITALSKEISEKSMDMRIPLGKTRDELHYLSLSLNKMFDKLQYSFLRQKEFIGNASHELKSPITRLLLYQENFLLNHDLSTAAQKEVMKQLDTTRRMKQLVKHLLDLSRLEQQDTLDRIRVSLTRLMTEVLDDYKELFPAKGIHLTKQIPEGLFISGDPEKLYRLFVNLIDNSIRYNLGEGGKVIVKGWKTDTDVVMEISNTGIQIPEEALDRVFEQFYRVEKSRAVIYGGPGLGLAIAKKIVQLHDGNINIRNGPEGLISLTVSFPQTGE